VKKIDLWPEPPKTAEGRVVLGCRLEGPADLPGRLWYAAEERAAPWLTPLADPWALSALFTAMGRGATLSVHGPVSRSLLANLWLFQKIWAAWSPGAYTPVDVEAERELDPGAAEGAEALLAFSGGVDSCFSALRGVRGRWGRGRIAAGLTVHGFDVPIAERAQFAGVRAKAARLLGSLGLESLTLETNVRELPGIWNQVHGAATAAALHWFAGRFAAGVVASTLPLARAATPYGTHLLTDQLLGSLRFPILHDGADSARLDKVVPLAGWPEAMENLRVCWEGSRKDRNCGVCEKCIRTKLEFLANGLELPATLTPAPTADEILGWNIKKEWQMRQIDGLIERSREKGLAASPWFPPLLERRRRLRRRFFRESLSAAASRLVRRPLRLLAIPLLAAALLAHPATLAAEGPRVETVKVLMLPYLDFAPLHIADEEGYFRDQGIVVERLQLTTSEQAVALLAHGDLDVAGAILRVDLLNAMARGAAIALVADKGHVGEAGDCSYASLVARSAWLSDLKERRLDPAAKITAGDRPATVLGYFIEKALASVAGAERIDLRVISNPAVRIEALRAGRLDVAPETEPFLTLALREPGIAEWLTAREVIPEQQFAVLAFGPRLVASSPEIGRRFMVAYLRGIRQYNQGKTRRNVELLAKSTGLQEDLVRQACWPRMRDDGSINLDRVLEFQAWAVKKGLQDRIVPPERFWDGRFTSEAGKALAATPGGGDGRR
jgi:ABC-type nitrate/sulfonate/bicarbonate transport system substrate-binding protein